MDTRPSNPTCAKCGAQVPPGAGFCPACGTAVSGTMLPVAPTIIGEPWATPAPTMAATIGPTGVVTSLDSPSPRPLIRAGDGPFQAGQQVGPRYTILKLLGTGGMGAVYQAFDHELGVAVAIKVISPSAQSDATA